jgi:hypothetical protein
VRAGALTLLRLVGALHRQARGGQISPQSEPV